MQRYHFPGNSSWQQPNASAQARTSDGIDHPRGHRFNVHHQDSYHGRRRKPKAASEQLFSKLSDEYYIRLACDECIVHYKDWDSHSYVIRKMLQGHRCSERRLLLQSKTKVKNRDNWTLIRSRPWSYDQTGSHAGDLCDYATLGRPCPDGTDCAHAHSAAEIEIWETVKIDLSVFIDDVIMSSLVTRSFVVRVCKLYDGEFVFLCRVCFLNGERPELVSKQQHVVAFRCGHTGISSKLLCFQTNDGSQTIPIIDGDAGNQANLSELVSECLSLKRNYQITDKEVEEESKRWKQQQCASAKPKSSADKVHRFTEVDCYAPEWYPSEVLAKQQRIKEMGVIDEYESALGLLRCEQNADNSGFIVRGNKREQYYEYFTEDQLQRLLIQEPEVHKRCLITLKSNDTAECEVVGTCSNDHTDQIIEVRGRRNCGQCFSGDDVLVKILDHAGKEQKFPLGKVVGVFKHSICCRSQVFVCARLSSKLMIPVCGTAPTIRIFDFLIMKKYKNLKHELVEVYDDEFRLKHIARLPKDTSKVVFVVRLRIWSTISALPLGYVTRILKSPETLEEELKLLNIVYQRPWINIAVENIKDSKKAQEVGLGIQEKTFSTNIPQGKNFPPSDIEDDFAVTIDSNGTRCFDDAFTVRHIEDSTRVIIGVHIADLTELVAKDDELDKEAAVMIEDWYISKHIRGVRPARTLFDGVRDECSLHAGSGLKSVISVFFTVNSQTGDILTHDFDRFKIRIRRNYSYHEAQVIINRYYAENIVPDRIEAKVITLHKITEKLRNRRLGRAAKYFDEDKVKGSLDKYADARRLVEELSLTANRLVTISLVEEDSQCVPIRRQMAPGAEESAEQDTSVSNKGLDRAALYLDENAHGDLDEFADTRRLMDELSLTANDNKAILRVANDLQYISIRRQIMVPVDTVRRSFQRKHQKVIDGSLYFAHPNWLPENLRANHSDSGPLCSRDTADILRRLSARDPTCRNLLQNNYMPATDISYDRLKERIMGTEILHPEHHLAMIAWFRIQRKAEYACSSDADINHFQLNFSAYVQFTSPLRRYLDAVVHRIMKGVLDKVDIAPYTVDEIRQMCQDANRMQRRKKGKEAYENMVKELDFVQATSEDGRMMTCFIVDFDDSELVLSFPALGQQSSDFKISYRNLSVRTMPEIVLHSDSNKNIKQNVKQNTYDPETKQDRIRLPSDCMQTGSDSATKEARITWEMRIYDAKPDKTGGRTTKEIRSVIEVDNGTQSYVYPFKNNPTAHGAAKKVNEELISKHPTTNLSAINRPRNCVTSEMKEGVSFIMQHVKFRMTFIPSMTIEVQLGKYGTTREGRRELQIDLVSLSNQLHDFCILHSQHPVQCLSHVTYQRSMKTYYRSLEHYRQIWLPILSMESATNAVSADPVVCRNVPLRIYSRVFSTDDYYNAHLSLVKRFCDQRKLTFLLSKCHKRFLNHETEAVDDFLCIRYKNPSAEEDSVEPRKLEDSLHQNKAADEDEESQKTSKPKDVSKTWIAHGAVTSCALENGIIEIKCRLTQVNFRLNPNHALFNRSSECRCTVEFMIKTLTDRRREVAVRKENISQLCKNIFLNRNMSNQQPIPVVGGLMNQSDMLNDEQRTAIDNARKYKFFLIHGPPGTGKTVAGVHLASCFVQSNRMRNIAERRQVLYCGPSNSAVDVAACKLMKEFGKSVRLIRIYSETWARRAYPVPRDLLEVSSASEASDELREEAQIRDHILHRRIRSPENPHSQDIRRYDLRFQANLATPWLVSDGEIKEYEDVVSKAEALEIKEADIVFCTCISSASARVTRNTRVQQIIIDECGMSAEPDCLVPLTSHDGVEQVVLVGDHLQLQPIAVNYDAKRLGLGRSLFERHSGNTGILTMLRKQYRMHDSICRFPSQYFYKGHLETAFPAADRPAPPENLWPVPDQRIVFCHLEGEEEKLKVATADGSLFSKSNEKEQKHVIKILRHLRGKCNIPVQSIAVLSQYKAQCTQLRRRLMNDLTKVHVSTVVASQGKEWDYVILSTVRSLSKYEIDPFPQRFWISEKLGTTADPHQINVALTRARNGLIILGNKNLLEVSPMWKALLDHYRKQGCLVNAEQFPPI